MNVRKLTLLAAALTIALSFIPAQEAEASMWVKQHTVWYDCVLGPYPGIVGAWIEYCDGSMVGWGWEPGHSCTWTDTDFLEYCGPEDPE